MKALLIIGVLLMIVGVGLASANSRPMTSLNDRGERIASLSIVIGFLLIITSGIIYLKE